MDAELSARFDNMEKLILDLSKASDARIAQVDGRVDALEEKMGALAVDNKQLRSDITMATKLLEQLLRDKDAVLLRGRDRCALKSESVAAAARRARYNRMALLRDWEQEGRLYTCIENGQRRYTSKITVDGERPRAIIIINK